MCMVRAGVLRKVFATFMIGSLKQSRLSHPLFPPLLATESVQLSCSDRSTRETDKSSISLLSRGTYRLPTSPLLATVSVRLSRSGTSAASTSGGAMLMSSITTHRPSATACMCMCVLGGGVRAWVGGRVCVCVCVLCTQQEREVCNAAQRGSQVHVRVRTCVKGPGCHANSPGTAVHTYAPSRLLASIWSSR